MSFSVFGFDIYVYGIIIASAILAAFVVGVLIFHFIGYKTDIAFLILLLSVPLGIVLARAYFVAFTSHQFNTFWDVINIRAGGMAIYGGIIGGALGIFIAARIMKVGFYSLADIVVITVILAQAIGRWGNFVNAEAYGVGVVNHVFPFTVLIDDGCCDKGYPHPHLAAFFLESMMNLIGFFVMIFLFLDIKLRKKDEELGTTIWGVTIKKREKHRWGTISAVYLIWYGLVRAIIEPFRTDSLLIFGSNEIVFNRVSFMLSIALVILGVLLLLAVKFGYVSQENQGCLKKPPTQTKTDT